MFLGEPFSVFGVFAGVLRMVCVDFLSHMVLCRGSGGWLLSYYEGLFLPFATRYGCACYRGCCNLYLFTR